MITYVDARPCFALGQNFYYQRLEALMKKWSADTIQRCYKIDGMAKKVVPGLSYASITGRSGLIEPKNCGCLVEAMIPDPERDYISELKAHNKFRRQVRGTTKEMRDLAKKAKSMRRWRLSSERKRLQRQVKAFEDQKKWRIAVANKIASAIRMRVEAVEKEYRRITLEECLLPNKCISEVKRPQFLSPPKDQVGDDDCISYLRYLYHQKPEIRHSPMLAFKLRAIIKRLRSQEKCEYGSTSYYILRDLEESLMASGLSEDDINYINNIIEKKNKLVPQMEDESGSSISPIQYQASNVVIETQREDSHAAPDISDSMNNLSFSGGDANSNYEELCNRWLVFDQISWTAVGNTSGANALIKEYNLPSYAISHNLSQANAAPFRLYRYWHGDMEIRAELNSNKFQVGQLQVSWYYCADEDENWNPLRRSIYSASSRDHFLLSAGSSNSGSMMIPYRHYLTQLTTKSSDKSYISGLNLGRLQVRVVNKLSIPDTVFQSCSVTFFIRFVNNKFSGMINADLDNVRFFDLKGQMMQATALINAGSNFVRTIRGDANRDNPPDSSPGTVVVPTASHSLSAMTGSVEPVNSMRMDMRGQTPHPSGRDEMSISNVVGIFGMINKFVWKSSNLAGSLLYECDAAPICDDRVYNKVLVNNMECREFPPVAVISSLFAFWRGEIEIRFDVIASQFHTGRFAAYLIPGAIDKVTYEEAKGSPYIVFDLAENRSFSFRVPFIANRPWWPRRLTASINVPTVNPPSYVMCYVVNPLIPMDNVSSEVEVNVYMRGGPSFEVSIPVSPSIGLSFNTDYYVDRAGDHCIPLPGYFPFYCSYYHSFNNKKVTLFYGTTAGKVTQFTAMDPKKVYALPDTVKIPGTTAWKDVPFRLWCYSSTTASVAVLYIVRVKDYPYNCVYCFGDLDTAKEYVKTGNETTALDYIKEGPWCQKRPNTTWIDCDGRDMIVCKTIVSDDYIMISSLSGEMDQKRDFPNQPADLLPLSASTRGGLLTFGESITDLKDVCRRFNRYLDVNLTMSNTVGDSALLNFPVMYQRCALDIENKETIDNRMRDGALAIIASGFRFARGGIRFKFLFEGLSQCDYVIIQLRPDQPSYDNHHRIRKEKSIHSYSDCLDFNYPCVFQGMVVNNCVEVEVPWYKSGDFSLLQQVNVTDSPGIVREFSSLGHLHIFISCDKAFSANVKILYSLADDGRFSVFQGFPPVFFLDQLPLPQLSGEMEEDVKVKLKNSAERQVIEQQATPLVSYGLWPSVSNMFWSAASHPPVKIVNKTAVVREGTRNQGVMDQFKSVANIPGKTVEVLTKADMTLNSLSDIIEMVKSLVFGPGGITSKFEALFSASIDWGTALTSIISQIGHVIIAGTFASLCWAVVSILGVIWGAGSQMIKDLWKFFSSWLPSCSSTAGSTSTVEKTNQTIGNGAPNKQPLGGNMAESGSEFTDVELCSLTSIMLTGAISMTNAVVNKPRNLQEFASGLFKNMRNVTASANSMTQFLRDNFMLLRRCFDYVVYGGTKQNSLMASLLAESEEIQKWASRVIGLTTCPVREQVKTNFKLINQVYAANATGSILKSKIACNTHQVKNLPTLLKLIKDISDLTEELLAEKINSPARYEPFVLWLDGAAGTGKSTMLGEITISLLKDVGFTTTDAPIYVKTAGNPHWNGITPKIPIVHIDDANAVRSPEFSGVQMAEMFNIKSCAQFNPPTAHLEEKRTFVNMEICGMCANDPYPSPPCLACPVAYYRRRDVMMIVERSALYVGKHNADIDQDVLDKKDHVRFRFYVDPSDPASAIEPPVHLPGLTYEEMYPRLLKRFKAYRARELIQYQKRLVQLTALYPTDVGLPLEMNVEKYIDTLYEARNEGVSFEESHKIYMAILERYQKSYLLTGEMGLKTQEQIEKDDANEEEIAEYNKKYKSEYPSTQMRVNEHADGIVVKHICSAEGIDDTLCKSVKRGLCPHRFIMSKDQNRIDTLYKEGKECIYYKSEWDMFEIETDEGMIPISTYPCASSRDDALDFGCCPLVRESDEFWKALSLRYPRYIADMNAYVTEARNLHYPSNLLEFQHYIAPNVQKGEIEVCIQKAQNQSKNIIPDTADFGSGTKVIGVDQRTWSQYFKDQFGRFWSWVKGLNAVVKVIATLMGIGGFLFGLYKVFGAEKNEEQIESEVVDQPVKTSWWCLGKTRATSDGELVVDNLAGQLESSGDTHQLKLAKVHRTVARNLVSLTPNSGPGAFDALMNKIEKNTFFLQAIDNNSSLTGRCVGLYNRKFIILQHYFDRFEAAGVLNVIIVRDEVALPLKLSDIKYRRYIDSGYCIAELPKSFNCFVKLTPYIASATDRFDFDPNCRLVQKVDNGRLHISHVRVKALASEAVPASNNSKPWMIVNGFEYNIGGPGFCGSLLVTMNKLQPVIVGIHTAGYQGIRGVSENLVRETFDVGDTVFDQLVPNIGEPDYDSARFQLTTQIIPVARLRSNECVRMGDKTKIRPSEIHGVFPVLTLPTPLSSKDPRILGQEKSPLLAGCDKRGNPCLLFPEDDVLVVYEDVRNLLIANCPPVRNIESELTVKEAIQGLPFQGYEKMQMSTSEGYPWLKNRPKSAKNKKWMFGWDLSETKLISIDKALDMAMTQQETQMQQGIIPPYCFTACLKDQRLPAEKTKKQGATRIFEISPVDLTVLTRKYFLDFCAAYSRNRWDCENTIGINENGTEWVQLFESLTNFSKCISDADYSAYGPSLSHQVLYYVFQAMCDWFDFYGAPKCSRVVRECLAEATIHSYNIAHDFLYMVISGLPSGCALTTYLNSLSNSFYIRLGFLGLARKYDMNFCDISKFSKKVKIFHNGDDLIMAIKEDITEWFNSITLSEFFSEYRIKMTPADKGGQLVPYRTIWEVQYLKKRFVPHPYFKSRILAPLDIVSVQDAANWIWECGDVREASLVNSEAAVRLAYGSGPMEFNRIRDQIIKVWLDKGVQISLPSWKQLDAQVWLHHRSIILEEDEKPPDVKILK